MSANHGEAVIKPKRVQLEINQIVKEFDGFKAVDNISLNIYQGEIFALLGASGCGKSTLLRLLAGFDTPTSGQIILDGNNLNTIPPHHRPINMMFQSYALFPHMTVEQNIAFGLKQDKLSRAAISAKVEEVLNLVRMKNFARRKPHQLSGGQQQRVALARSLAKEPRLLLLDEPMGALDKKLRSQMQLELIGIIEKVGVTCVMVTHDQEEAMTMADRVGIMDAGVIRQVGNPIEVYEQPNCRMTAEFIGSANIFEGQLTVDGVDHIQLACDVLPVPIHVAHSIAGSLGMDMAYALRPEKIIVSRHPSSQPYNTAVGVIKDIAYLGSHSIYHIQLPSGYKMMASVANTHRVVEGRDSERLNSGDEVHLSWGDRSGVVLTS